MLGFLKCIERDDYENAARYLQSGPEGNANWILHANEARDLNGRFTGSIALLSDDPNGTIEPGLPPGQVRAGVLTAGSTTVDVILVRVDDPAFGKIWLISKETVASIPQLYAQIDSEAPAITDRIMPAALTTHSLLKMSLARWLEWLLSIPISWLLVWLLAFVLSTPARIRSKLRGLPFRPIWETRLGMPLKCIIAILLHSFFVYLLGPPILYRVYYFRFIAAILVGCFVWLIGAIADRGFEHAVTQTRTQHRGGESILVVMQRLTRIVLVIIALIVALAIFGLNVRTELAGLGIGGLAIALAAQRTLENIIGGLSLLMDKAVHLGDFCQIGDQRGIVEDIGLRSLKLRTLEQTLLVVPNGSLAQMQFGNLTGRSKLLIQQTFALRIETEVDQLRFIMDRVQTMLHEHPAIEAGTSRIRVTRFVGAAFELELVAYGTTGDWPKFTAIRQDVILKIAEIVEASGTRFAAPTQLAYLSRDPGLDAQKASDFVRQVTELRASDAFRSPGEARTGTK
jgi:MscS family membrane protein